MLIRPLQRYHTMELTLSSPSGHMIVGGRESPRQSGRIFKFHLNYPILTMDNLGETTPENRTIFSTRPHGPCLHYFCWVWMGIPIHPSNMGKEWKRRNYNVLFGLNPSKIRRWSGDNGTSGRGNIDSIVSGWYGKNWPGIPAASKTFYILDKILQTEPTVQVYDPAHLCIWIIINMSFSNLELNIGVVYQVQSATMMRKNL